MRRRTFLIGAAALMVSAVRVIPPAARPDYGYLWEIAKRIDPEGTRQLATDLGI